MAFKFMYNGKNYAGLVIQNHTNNTVEAKILRALLTAKLIENFEDSNFARCGRTDTGVSSSGNVFSIYLRYKSGMDYVSIINNLLPDDILITGASIVDDSFDARFSCLYREYKYFFLQGGMDIEKMKIACTKLVGVHNFKNFCKIDKSNPNYLTKNYERRIYQFSIDEYEKLIFPCDEAMNINNDYFKMFYVTIRGSAFLWHQVRCMMGILFLIGKGSEDIDIIDSMFNTKNGKVYNYELASELNLVLSDCQYEGINFENTIENYSSNFFSISKIYEQNLTQIAINSFFFRNVVNLMRINENEKNIVELMENRFRRKRKYTKLLSHKVNRHTEK